MLKEEKLTHTVIKCFYHVYNTLGYGFLEKVYENAFLHTLQKRNIRAACQVPIKVFFEQTNVGLYFADIIIENKIIVELKAMEAIHQMHEFQLLNYLKATHIEIGFIFNFGPEPSFRRKVFENKNKT